MRVVYKLEVTQKGIIPDPCGPGAMQVDDAQVSWEVDAGGSLQLVSIEFSGVPLRKSADGRILTTWPELESRAFSVAAYVANCALIQVGVDIIDPASVLRTTPEALPETSAERAEFGAHPMTRGGTIQVGWAVRGRFQPGCFVASYNHSAAIAIYADGLRAADPCSQFEQLYKVLGHFFPNKTGNDLDAAVSAHASNFDPSRYSKKLIKGLRELRNDCMHPDRPGYVSSQNVTLLRKVPSQLPDIRELAHLLLKHPP